MTLDDILSANTLPTDRASLIRIIRSLAAEIKKLRDAEKGIAPPRAAE